MKLITAVDRIDRLRYSMKMMTYTLVGAGLLLSNSSYANDEISIADVWARESPPTVTNGAVYLTIEDRSGSGDRLIGASTDIAAKTELHEHRMEMAHDSGSGDQNKQDGDAHEHGHGSHKHESQSGRDHGMMKMRQVDAIDIPANGTVELKPMGYHVMLFDLKAPLKDGEHFELTLRFENAGETIVPVDVRKPGS